MKTISIFLTSIFILAKTFAQTPQGINYQGIARNNVGVPLVSQAIGIQLSVLNGSASGTVAYTETHALTTDAFGLFTLVIGSGTATSGTFAGINWGTGGSKWMKVSLDATGGSAYQLMGTTQLMSVPYALYAGNVTNNGGKQTIVLSDDITNAQATALIAAEVGPNTQEIKIVGTTVLTTVDLSMIQTAISIEINGNGVLANVNLSGLTRCDGQLIVFDNANLTTINLSALAKITDYGLEIISNGITNLNLGALTNCNGAVSIRNNFALGSLNLNSLAKAKRIDLQNNDLMIEYNLPMFTGALGTGSNNFSGNSLLTTITVPLLSTSVGLLNVNDNPLLTNLSFPQLIAAGGVSFQNNSLLTSVSTPLYTTGGFNCVSNPILTTITAPLLSTGSFSFQNNPQLIAVPSSVLTSATQFNIENCDALTGLNSPLLTTCTSFRIVQNLLVATATFPGLQTVTGSSQFIVGSNAALASLSLPLLTSSSTTSTYIFSNLLLTNLNIASLAMFGSELNLNSNALPTTQINTILAQLVAIAPAITGKQISLSQNPPAPPTGAGITNKATLIANGNTVFTN